MICKDRLSEKSLIYLNDTLREKCPDTKFLSVFSPNAGKYGPEKTPYLDTFHAVTLASIAFIKNAFFVDAIPKFAIVKGQFINETDSLTASRKLMKSRLTKYIFKIFTIDCKIFLNLRVPLF